MLDVEAGSAYALAAAGLKSDGDLGGQVKSVIDGARLHDGERAGP